MSKGVLPLEVPVTLPGEVKMIFRRIVDVGETAAFWRGSRGEYDDEEPRHRVRLKQPFYLGETPVTQTQYRAMAESCLDRLKALEGNMGADPSHFKGDKRPVERVDFQDAEVVADWLTGSGLLPGGWNACLPTEAQWEYACRAGTETKYWRGDGEAALAEVDWYSGNAGGETHAVGLKPANPFGLHDMHGNVWEWCKDAWDEGAYRKCPDGVIDPCEVDKKSNRSLRGGSWNFSAGYCRSAFRGGYWAALRDRDNGFRLCLLPTVLSFEGAEQRQGACSDEINRQHRFRVLE